MSKRKFSKNFLVFDALTEGRFEYNKIYVEILGDHISALVLSYLVSCHRQVKDEHGDAFDVFHVCTHDISLCLMVPHPEIKKAINKIEKLKIFEIKEKGDAWITGMHACSFKCEALTDLIAEKQQEKLDDAG